MIADQPVGRDVIASRLTPAPRTVIVASLLAAGAIAWAAVPMSTATSGAEPALIAAICCAAIAAAQLAVRPADDDPPDVFAPVVVRAWWRVSELLRAVPWAQGTVVAVLLLEALHPSRPWHTAVLGAVLLAYLFGAHLAETGESARTLRPQLPLIGVGLILLALSVGVAALPVGSGAAATWLRVLAVAVAVIVGALIVPV